MKAVLGVVLATMLAAMAVFAYAAPLAQSTDFRPALPSDDDKDKEKEKDKKGD